jgi:hypothetical protein
MPGSPLNPPAYETIDFELTDFALARDALEEPPAGLEEVARELVRERLGGWENQRHKPTPTDRALSGRGIDWLLALAPDLRPKALSDRFPRLVNLLAEHWDDATRRVELLDSLLYDQRGNRVGFPPAIRDELQLLRDAATQPAAPPC